MFQRFLRVPSSRSHGQPNPRRRFVRPSARILFVAATTIAVAGGGVALAAAPAQAAGYSGSGGDGYGGWGYGPPPHHHHFPFPFPFPHFPFPFPFPHLGHTTGHDHDGRGGGGRGEGGPGTVLTSCWQGSSCTGKDGSWTISLREPSGLLPTGAQTVITNEAPSNSSTLCFGLAFYRNGSPITGPAQGVTTTVTGVSSGQSVEGQVAGGWSPVPSAVGGGQASFSATGNRSYVLVGDPSSGPGRSAR